MKQMLHKNLFKAALMSTMLLGLCPSTMNAGRFIPISLKPYFDTDLILGAGETTTTAKYYSQERHETGGFAVTPMSLGGVIFQFGWTGSSPFYGNDCICISKNSGSVEIVLDEPLALNGVYFAGATMSGTSYLTVQETYVDNTTGSAGSKDITAWSSSVGDIFGKTNDDGTGYSETGARVRWNFKECSTAKKVKSFTLSTTSNNDIYVFAISGKSDYYTLDVTSVGWSSMYLPYAVDIPTGVNAYYASKIEGSTVTLSELTGAVPANTGVIVKASEGSYNFTFSSSEVDPVTGNIFDGVTASSPYTANTVYVLSPMTTTDKPIFQNYTGAALGAYKAYLPAAGAAEVLNFVFDDATAISNIDTAVPSKVRYNLNGQAVGNDYKGIVIVNGKKYINK